METWAEYVAWVDRTAQRRWSGTGDDKAELLEIWGLGLGEELLEMFAEIDDLSDPLWIYVRTSGNHRVEEERAAQRKRVLDEASDYIYYVARVYLDTGNERRTYLVGEVNGTLRCVCRHACRLVGAIKKALRSQGRIGVLALTTKFSIDWPLPMGDNLNGLVGGGKLLGRAAEVGTLLDLALGSFERWLVASGSSLGEVMGASVAKIEKKIADGKFDQVRSRLEKGA